MVESQRGMGSESTSISRRALDKATSSSAVGDSGMAQSSSMKAAGVAGGSHIDPLKVLYPFVNEAVTPLPRCWSSTDKFPFLGVSHGNLRVTYRGIGATLIQLLLKVPRNVCILANSSGQGKTHKDAAAVRALHAIPPTCGIYYFEVKIVSKGRDGYMGIGVCQKEVSMNRLPGWDRYSYGYHGDDGNFFCSSGSGAPYGPTFTTGDTVGCGLNLIDNTLFYTRNGHNLGVAYSELPPNLYPTVGLQTPGEIIDTNFGQQPFLYDIYADIREAHMRVVKSIAAYEVPMAAKDRWMKQLVSSYLVHHGYHNTLDALNRSSSRPLIDIDSSIIDRKNMQLLVQNGRIGDAIDSVNRLYPGLLDRRQSLLFTLKCRQFVEMIAGGDAERSAAKSNAATISTMNSEASTSSVRSPPTRHFYGSLAAGNSGAAAAATSPPSSSYMARIATRRVGPKAGSPRAPTSAGTRGHHQIHSLQSVGDDYSFVTHHQDEGLSSPMDAMPPSRHSENGSAFDAADGTLAATANGASSCRSPPSSPRYAGLSSQSFSNGAHADEANGVDHGAVSLKRMMPALQLSENIYRVLEFGNDITKLSKSLRPRHQVKHKKRMQEAFSLMAYSDPWASPQGYLLKVNQRLPVAAALNCAILDESGLPTVPAIETLFGHAAITLRSSMATNGIGAAAFFDPLDVIEDSPKYRHPAADASDGDKL